MAIQARLSEHEGRQSMSHSIGLRACFHPSRLATVVSIPEEIGCVPRSWHGWLKKAEVDSGKRAGVTKP